LVALTTAALRTLALMLLSLSLKVSDLVIQIDAVIMRIYGFNVMVIKSKSR